MKITNSTIDIYLRLDAIENMSVSVACRLSLAECCCWQIFKIFFESYQMRIVAFQCCYQQ